MPRKRYSPEQIINNLRQAEVLPNQGQTIAQASKAVEIVQQTHYHWRQEYGSTDITQARKLKDLEEENTRLKKLVADPSLDNVIIKDVQA